MNIFQIVARVNVGLILIIESLDSIINTQKHIERIKNITLINNFLDSEEKETLTNILIKISGIFALFSSLCLLSGKRPRFNSIFLSSIACVNVILKNPFWIEKNNNSKFHSILSLLYDSTLFSCILLLITHGIPNRKWRKYYKKKAKPTIK